MDSWRQDPLTTSLQPRNSITLPLPYYRAMENQDTSSRFLVTLAHSCYSDKVRPPVSRVISLVSREVEHTHGG